MGCGGMFRIGNGFCEVNGVLRTSVSVSDPRDVLDVAQELGYQGLLRSQIIQSTSIRREHDIFASRGLELVAPCWSVPMADWAPRRRQMQQRKEGKGQVFGLSLVR